MTTYYGTVVLEYEIEAENPSDAWEQLDDKAHSVEGNLAGAASADLISIETGGAIHEG